MGNICPKLTQTEHNSPRKILKDEEEADAKSLLFDNDPLIPVKKRSYLKSRIYRREYLTEAINDLGLIPKFKEVIQKLETVETKEMKNIATFGNKNQRENYFVKLDSNVHQYYFEGIYHDNSPEDILYGFLLDLQEKKKDKGLRLREFRIMAHFEVENMVFLLIKVKLRRFLFFGKNEFLFIQGIKKISKNEFLVLRNSIEVDESYGDMSNLNEIREGYAHYFRFEGEKKTHLRSFVEIEFNRKEVDLNFSTLRPIFEDFWEGYSELGVKLAKSSKGKQINWQAKLDTRLQNIYGEME